MTTEATQQGGRNCAPKIPPRTVNFDHLSDAEKMELWRSYRSAQQHFIDLARVGL